MGLTREALGGWGWRVFLRPLLFRFSAEYAHRFTLRMYAWLLKVPGCRSLCTRLFRVDDPRLHVRRFGVAFPNPVGLSAGMDKNAEWCSAFRTLGFGFIEVGTVTAQPQDGNPQPRIFRLKADLALLNRMGSPNEGAAAVAARLERRPPQGIIGVNIGKTARVPNESAAADYLASFERLYPHAAYIVLNISSPNTPGLRRLQATEFLGPILRTLIDRNAALALARNEPPRPLLVKIAPDLDAAQLDEIVDLCIELHLGGIIVANTTTSRDGLRTPPGEVQALGDGGISGRPLTERARALVATVYRKVGKALPIIGVGGIMTEEDAWQMLRAGASLIQLHSGLIYQGPGFVAAINRHLIKRLAERGSSTLEDVIGEASQHAPSSVAPERTGFTATLP